MENSITANTNEVVENSGVSYLRGARKKLLILITFVGLTIFSLCLDIALGPGGYPLSEVLSTIWDGDSISIQLEVIVWDLRAPIAVMAVLVGCMLAISGAQMQTVLNNPLADPFTLGIASAASFGAALAIVLGEGLPVQGEYLVPVNAFFFAFLTSLVLYLFTKLRGVNVETMVLVGIALFFTFGSLLSLLQYGANETDLQQLIFWMMGSLGKATWYKNGICLFLIAIMIPFIVYNAWSMTALRLGEEKARSMGVPVEALRLKMLFFVSLLSATSVSFVGIVGFVGLVGPHISRILVGEDQRFFLPVAAAAGALLMSVTSILSKMLVTGVIFPIGIITSLVGIPFFLSLILSARRKAWQ